MESTCEYSVGGKIKRYELGRIYVWVRQATALGITSNTVSVHLTERLNAFVDNENHKTKQL